MADSIIKRLIIIMLTMMILVGCADRQQPSVTNETGYSSADSIISDIGDTRNFERLIEITDSFERTGDISEVRAIF